MMTTIERHRTALRRSGLSRPLRQAYEDGLLTGDTTVFDYGCGHGDDLRLLRALGIKADGWDPIHRPDSERSHAAIVNLGYVINVIESPPERVSVIRDAWHLATELLVVSARTSWDRDSTAGRPFGDGRITGTNTFQKFYEPEELRHAVETSLGESAVTAAPGVVYVFKDPRKAQSLLARSTRSARPRIGVAQLIYQQHHDLQQLQEYVDTHRALPPLADHPEFSPLIETFGSLSAAFSIIRAATGAHLWTDVSATQRSSMQRYLAHVDDLQPLIDFVTERGRLPHAGELKNEARLAELFGSIRAAFSLVRRVTDRNRWQEITEEARTSFLVYAALAAFGGRPKFSELPDDLQHDAKDLFGSYRYACEQADMLLHSIADLDALDNACQGAPFGKLTPEALYVHVGHVDDLPPVLRVYEAAARHLTGNVDDATIVKLHRLKPQVSFLVYPGFDRDPHPALEASIVARLPQLRTTHRYFGDSVNPPILHRKETFLPAEHPDRAKFARLTQQEERAGLLDRPDIGTRSGWEQALAHCGYRLSGHRLMRADRVPTVRLQ